MTAGVERHQPADAARVVPAYPARVDLHSHTLRSDGVLEPTELAAQAAAAGLRLLAITDHDTLAGVRELRATSATPPGLEILPGIEINAVIREATPVRESEVHILGLGVDPDDDRLEATLAAQRDARRLRFERMVERLRDLDMPVDGALADLPPTDDDDALGRPRIARALIACGYATTIEDAFVRHLSKGRPAYVPRDGVDPIEAIEAISAAGGLPSLAHFSEAASHLAFVRELIGAGLRGIEVHYRSFDARTVSEMAALATELRLVATGGTDFHGDHESYAEAHAQLSFPDDAADPFLAAVGHAPLSR